MGSPSDYKLSEIKPNSDKGILNLQTKVELPIHFTYETNKDKIFKVYGEKSNQSDLQKRTIVREKIKIKNAGVFRGFLKDRRISSLLPYLPDVEIQFEALNKELDWYNEARMEVFKKIYVFERKVVNEKGLKKYEDKVYIDHEDILKSIISETDERFVLIKELRNAFSHSTYPAYLLFKDKIDGSGFNELKNYSKEKEEEFKSKSIVIQFKNLTIKYYNELFEKK